MRKYVERDLLRDWVWNVLLYPIAFFILAIVLVLVALATPAIDHGLRAQIAENPAAAIADWWLSMILFWSPGVALALTALVLLARLPDSGFRRVARLVTPLTAVGTWLIMMYVAGTRLVYVSPRPEGIGPHTWLVVAIGLLIVGLLTRISRPLGWSSQRIPN